MAEAGVVPTVVLGGWWYLRGLEKAWRFMSHTKWQRRVTQRAVVYLSCKDVGTMWQTMEKEGEEEKWLIDLNKSY